MTQVVDATQELAENPLIDVSAELIGFEFQDGTRVAPFVVLRSDFVAVLESDRGSPRQLTSERTKAPSNSAGDLLPDESTKPHLTSNNEG